MKTLLFVLISFSAYAQFTMTEKSITFKADTMTLERAFDHIEAIRPTFYRGKWLVEKDGKIYRRQTYAVSKKKHIYVRDGKRWHKIEKAQYY